MIIKHTPGPWRSGDVFNTVFGPPNGNPSPLTIATVHMLHSYDDGSKNANARLIAAAPELLEACKAALHDKPPVCLRPTVVEMLISAIRKAEGK